MNIFIIMLNCLQSDPFKLETGGMVDMKELKKKYIQIFHKKLSLSLNTKKRNEGCSENY